MRTITISDEFYEKIKDQITEDIKLPHYDYPYYIASSADDETIYYFAPNNIDEIVDQMGEGGDSLTLSWEFWKVNKVGEYEEWEFLGTGVDIDVIREKEYSC